MRLEFGPGADPRLKQLLQDRFALTAEDVYELPGGLDVTSLLQIADLPNPGLRYPVWTPLSKAPVPGEESIFDTIAKGDLSSTTRTTASMRALNDSSARRPPTH